MQWVQRDGSGALLRAFDKRVDLEQADAYLTHYDTLSADSRVQETGTMMAWDSIRTTIHGQLRSWEAYGPPPELRLGLLPQQLPPGPRGA